MHVIAFGRKEPTENKSRYSTPQGIYRIMTWSCESESTDNANCLDVSLKL